MFYGLGGVSWAIDPIQLKGPLRKEESPMNLCVCVCCLFRGCVSCAPETVGIVTVLYVFGVVDSSSTQVWFVTSTRYVWSRWMVVCLELRSALHFQMANQIIIIWIVYIYIWYTYELTTGEGNSPKIYRWWWWWWRVSYWGAPPRGKKSVSRK